MRISKLFIDKQVVEHPTARSIRSRIDVPAEIVESAGRVYQEVSAAADPVKRGKEILYLTRNRGAFFKKCPA